MIDKSSEEFKVWGEAFKVRDKWKNNPDLFTDEGFKKMKDETSELYSKYKNTSGDQAALYLCMAIREMCNEDWKNKNAPTTHQN